MKTYYQKISRSSFILFSCVLVICGSLKAQTRVTNGTFNTDMTGWTSTASGGNGFAWKWSSNNGGSTITNYDGGSTYLSQPLTGVTGGGQLSFDLFRDNLGSGCTDPSATLQVSYNGVVYVTYNGRSTSAPVTSNGATSCSANSVPINTYAPLYFTLPAGVSAAGTLEFKMTTSCTSADNMALDNIYVGTVSGGGGGCILPITLTNFTATASSCTANLAWQTASEQNSKYYSVEYSADGTSFSEVGKVTSKNSESGAFYNYAYGLGNGTGYFRLKAVDFDGKFIYSGTVTASGTGACGTGLQVTVSPNPTTGIVNIQGLVTGSHITLMDEQGKRLSETIANSTNQSFNLSTFMKGVYIMKVETADGKVSNVKVVKL